MGSRSRWRPSDHAAGAPALTRFAVSRNHIDGNAQSDALLCARQVDGMIDDGLVKDNALSSAYCHPCVP